MEASAMTVPYDVAINAELARGTLPTPEPNASLKNGGRGELLLTVKPSN